MESNTQPKQPDEILEYIELKKKEYLLNDYTSPPNLIGALIGHVEKAIRETLPGYAREEISEMRRRIFKYIFSLETDGSSKDLIEDEIYALKEWIDAVEVDNSWLPQQNFSDEIRFLIWRLL